MPVLLILLLLHLYVGFRLVPALPGMVAPGLLALWLLASLVLIPASFFGRRASGPVADRLSWAGMLALGVFSLLGVSTLLRDGVLLVAWALGQVPAVQAGTGAAVRAVAGGATLQAASAWAVLGFTGLGTLAGVVGARRRAPVRRVDIAVDGLPAALHGFTVAQITDVHVGPTVKRAYVQRIVDAVNTLQPDAVAITGDLVDGRVADLRDDVAPLAGLRSRHGSFFVTGNHEYYSGAEEWVAALRGLGLQVLLNQHVVLQHGGARVVMAGVADWSAGHFVPGHRSDAQAAMAGAPADAGLRLLLAHQPRSAAGAAEAGFDVQLSGHTHGGQIWPWGFFVRFQQPFTAGLDRLGRLWVYTSRGTGYWGPPLRLGAPSEITCVRFIQSNREPQ
ncbi:metallophosphoesterase [Aquincola tertiaricarbonis]|uniref:Metallophosphoesterase n=1 Tax=Aquincola tertiaricarbonis TaxID=391953 RepID=A0ABY4SHI6_AQUTE|nr:metallophosphoesterase [Aquincola tertiaricarbonis]URI11597.1 metallophosphoesterase [Aquincola tertiaricarbonis]